MVQEPTNMSQQDKPVEKPDVFKEIEKISDPSEMLEKCIINLKKYGGYDLLEGAVDLLENMNPRKRAAKKMFLNESEFKESREKLAKNLFLWINLLSQEGKVTDLVDACKNEAENVDRSLKKNLKIALEKTQNLEKSYRAVAFFFANTDSSEVEYLSITNVDKKQLKDSTSNFFKVISDEITRFYDVLDLRNNYSLLVIPGYLGSKQVVDMWGKIAHKNKVMLVTDFKDRLNFQMLKESIEKESLSGGDSHLANVLMTCNWLVGRKNYAEVGEEEELYVPSAGALAGKLYNTKGIIISQGAAGKKFGTLSEVKGTRLELRKAEINSLIDLSMIPMVLNANRVEAFSNRTLFNGNPIGLQEYSIVRVFDWIGKVFMNFFNDVAFQNWNSSLKQDLKQEICHFLDEYRGPGKLIENYAYGDIKQDEITKNITVEISIKPFFAASNFYIKLTGHDGSAGKEWDQEVN